MPLNAEMGGPRIQENEAEGTKRAMIEHAISPSALLASTAVHWKVLINKSSVNIRPVFLIPWSDRLTSRDAGTTVRRTEPDFALASYVVDD
jgi:hypothetical protein